MRSFAINLIDQINRVVKRLNWSYAVVNSRFSDCPRATVLFIAVKMHSLLSDLHKTMPHLKISISAISVGSLRCCNFTRFLYGTHHRLCRFCSRQRTKDFLFKRIFTTARVSVIIQIGIWGIILHDFIVYCKGPRRWWRFSFLAFASKFLSTEKEKIAPVRRKINSNPSFKYVNYNKFPAILNIFCTTYSIIKKRGGHWHVLT